MSYVGRAAYALEMIGDEKAVEVLKAALSEEREVRDRAFVALEAIARKHGMRIV